MEDESLRSGLLLLFPFVLFLLAVVLLRDALLIVILNLWMNYHLRKIRLQLSFSQTRIILISMRANKQDEND